MLMECPITAEYLSQSEAIFFVERHINPSINKGSFFLSKHDHFSEWAGTGIPPGVLITHRTPLLIPTPTPTPGAGTVAAATMSPDERQISARVGGANANSPPQIVGECDSDHRIWETARDCDEDGDDGQRAGDVDRRFAVALECLKCDIVVTCQKILPEANRELDVVNSLA
jgi:hypothetical protein